MAVTYRVQVFVSVKGRRRTLVDDGHIGAKGEGLLWGGWSFSFAPCLPMFITRRSHNEIVALHVARLADAEAREAATRHDRDVYRNLWLERLGVKYPIPKPAEATTIAQPGQPPSDLENQKTFRLDRGEWTQDDRAWFDDYHARPMLQAGAKPEELDFLYFQKYGNEKPLAVFLDGAFPIE